MQVGKHLYVDAHALGWAVAPFSRGRGRPWGSGGEHDGSGLSVRSSHTSEPEPFRHLRDVAGFFSMLSAVFQYCLSIQVKAPFTFSFSGLILLKLRSNLLFPLSF